MWSRLSLISCQTGFLFNMAGVEDKPILCVGMVCEDTIVKVDIFPAEDTDQRTLDQWKTRGGNASNMSTVLASFGLAVELFASMADDSINRFIIQDLAEHKIDFSKCPKHDGEKTPNSYIILNSSSGSRTILHTNLGLPELTARDFMSVIHPQEYSWIHFEGRPNLSETEAMLKSCQGKKVKISLELEKVGRNFDPLLSYVDLIFVSKEYAKFHGFQDKSEVVEKFHEWKGLKNSSSIVICAWGDQGAAGKDTDGRVHSFPPQEPKNGVVDTIGAGDTFNASIIASLVIGRSLSEALESACRVAGCKVGQFGFANLKQVFL